jgi:hypothetical protein
VPLNAPGLEDDLTEKGLSMWSFCVLIAGDYFHSCGYPALPEERSGIQRHGDKKRRKAGGRYHVWQ